MAPVIRRARVEDADAILPLSLALMADESIAAPPGLRDGLVRLLGDAALGFVLVDDGLRGHAVCTFGYDLEFAGRDAWLTELYVGLAHRGSGLGAALLAAVEREAAAHGVCALHLQVRPDNPSRRLYARAGFAPVPREVMTKPLGAGSR